MFNVCVKTTYDVYLAVPHRFIKMFHLQQSQGLVDSPRRSNSCRAYQELGQHNFYLFHQKKVSFQVI